MIKSGARFNVEKAKWFNKEYLRMKPIAELTDLFIPILESKGVTGFSRDYVEKAVELVRERATFTADLWDSAQCLFVAPTEYSQKDVDKFWKAEHYEYCFEVCQYITGVNFGFDDLEMYRGPMMQEPLETAIVDYIKTREYPMGKVMNSLRLALTGSASGLGIAAILSFIGRSEFARRMSTAAEKLGRK